MNVKKVNENLSSENHSFQPVNVERKNYSRKNKLSGRKGKLLREKIS